jgi:hypothetical protein
MRARKLSVLIATTIRRFDPTNRHGAMKYFLATTLAALVAAASSAAIAQTPAGQASGQASSGNDTSALPCDIGYVSGVGGSVPSLREYLATPRLDQFRYLKDNDINCQVSDEGRASACTGVTSLSHEKVSIYENVDSTLVSVVARVELEHGTYPVIIAVRKKDVQCQE